MAEQWPRPGDGHRPELRLAPHAADAPASEPDGNSAPAAITPRGWQPRLLLERLSAELWAELDTLEALRDHGKARDARDVAIVVGILCDKAAALAKQTGVASSRPDPAEARDRMRQIAATLRQRAG